MLEQFDAAVTLAVSNIEKSRAFYANVRGFPEVSRMGRDLITFKSGATKVSIYRTQAAGSNKATAAAWEVGDELEAIVADLKVKGVQFEHYDMPGSKLEG